MERNVSVFVVAVLATVRGAGLNHSDVSLGNLKERERDLVGGLWRTDLISSTGDRATLETKMAAEGGTRDRNSETRLASGAFV